MIYEDSLSKLAALKQDARNFGFKMMFKERQKQDTLEPLYKIAKEILPKLGISKQNIDNYVKLASATIPSTSCVDYSIIRAIYIFYVMHSSDINKSMII